MKKLIGVSIPVLLMLIVGLLSEGTSRLFLFCVLSMIQGALGAGFKIPSSWGVLLNVLAYLPSAVFGMQMIELFYLLTLNILVYYGVKTVMAIYQK